MATDRKRKRKNETKIDKESKCAVRKKSFGSTSNSFLFYNG